MGRISIVKMATLSKGICRVDVILIRIPMKFFTDLRKHVWKNKRPRRAKAILSYKNKDGGITIPNHKLYYRGTVTNTAPLDSIPCTK